MVGIADLYVLCLELGWELPSHTATVRQTVIEVREWCRAGLGGLQKDGSHF